MQYSNFKSPQAPPGELSRYGRVHVIPTNRVLRSPGGDLMSMLVKTLVSSALQYRVRGVFVSDGKESILVYEEGLMKALNVRLPFIPLFQRTAIRYIIEMIGPGAKSGPLTRER